MIRAVIFDLGGVIVKFTNDQYYHRLAEISGKKHEFVKRAVESKELPLLESGKISITEFNAAVAKKLDIKTGRMDWFSFYKKTVKLDMAMLKLVDSLHKRHVTAFLTNIDESRYLYTAKILDMDLFDYKFQSCYLGMRKPDPRIYVHVLKKMHIKPEEAVYIDDRLENVRGAKRVGINAVHFKNRRFLGLKLAEMGL